LSERSTDRSELKIGWSGEQALQETIEHGAGAEGGAGVHGLSGNGAASEGYRMGLSFFAAHALLT